MQSLLTEFFVIAKVSDKLVHEVELKSPLMPFCQLLSSFKIFLQLKKEMSLKSFYKGTTDLLNLLFLLKTHPVYIFLGWNDFTKQGGVLGYRLESLGLIRYVF